MKNVLLLFMLIVWSMPLGAWELDSSQREAVLAQAQQAFEQGLSQNDDEAAEAKLAFARSADKYALLAQLPDASGELLFNLGNAQLFAGDLPQALASFNRAAQRMPGDRRVAQHLAYTRMLLQGESSPEKPTWWMRAATMVPWPMQQWSFVVAWTVLWLGWAGALCMSQMRWRWIIIPAGVVCVVMGLAGAITLQTVRSPTRGIVLHDGVLVRQGDSAAFDPYEGAILDAGTSVQVIEQRGDWLKVARPDGGAGWIPQRDAAVIQPMRIM